MLGLAAGLVGLSLSSAPPASAAVAVDDVPIAAWGVNGTVFATVIAGDTVVVGGTFTQAVSPGGQSVSRVNLAAFSLSTGALLPSWHADTNGAVRALATDGNNVFVGGLFTSVADSPRQRLAKLDASTGTLDPGFSPDVSSGVRAIDVAGSELYIGGGFGAVNNARHAHVAKLDASSGAVDAAFQASTDRAVWAVSKSPADGTLFVGGLFGTLDNGVRLGVGGVDSTTGELVGPAFDHTDIPVYGLDVSPDGTILYGAQKSNQASAWRISTGLRIWRVGTEGNVQAVKYFDDTVYMGFHDGYQGDDTVKVLAVNPLTGAVDPSFRPSVNTFMGIHTLDVTAGGLVIGGAFTAVSGVTARHLAIFRP